MLVDNLRTLKKITGGVPGEDVPKALKQRVVPSGKTCEYQSLSSVVRHAGSIFSSV